MINDYIKKMVEHYEDQDGTSGIIYKQTSDDMVELADGRKLKTKLDTIEDGANKYVHPGSL